MSEPKSFNFSDVANLPNFEDALVGFVPKNLSSADDLLQGVADVLSFPAYFGRNWNALYDCLRDFHWTEKRNVFLVHSDLPQLDKDDLKAYLEVLRDAVADWQPGESHAFIVIFDRSIEVAVMNALNMGRD
ncbi:RNAse (barnase) inhibitor barstar [Dyella sp. SG562]|jgi:RNAse (barnase) inhibitor barstar|uniref:barstar family protein n=1 Tax=Dyella sp. SG562 TaxID=2587017 RepID=UPI0014221F1B|nr:barstar family protein [Dyella sp. SG562]NII75021.1 RNAse (barnase) inhibitor barstar [Dyella sp. SG562]